MDMSSVNFLVVALSCTLLFVVGQRGSVPAEESLVSSSKQSSCAMHMDDLKKLTGGSATFLSHDEAQKEAVPIPELDTKSIPNYCSKSCRWQLLNFALVGEDSVYYTPATGLGFGGALLYQSIYACTCSSPGTRCGGQCVASSSQNEESCSKALSFLQEVCTCPVRVCEHSYSWHLTLVWPNYPRVTRCNPPVWKRVQIPTGCCCKVQKETRGK